MMCFQILLLNVIHTFHLNILQEFLFLCWIACSVWSIPIFSQQNNWFCIDIVISIHYMQIDNEIYLFSFRALQEWNQTLS